MYKSPLPFAHITKSLTYRDRYLELQHTSSNLQPTSNMAPKEKAEAQTFTFQEVACMIAAMNAGGVTLGAKHYGLMAKLDGERTASGFEHKFRAVKARGKELGAELNDGVSTPKTPKSGKKTTTSTGKKRGSEFYATRFFSLNLADKLHLHREGR